MVDQAIIEKIQKIVGRENVLADKESRICYSYDATTQKYMPELVVFPHTPGEISQIMRLANESHFPVVPRGAGTGFTGGTLPVEGGVVLVLVKMNKILKIDPENLLAIVE
ncbi:MAG: FAD-binding protein, partial [Deltaproteobacteria bacterium]|nr:FAD-binding protein [Deltaproteobacteria bacterium]